MEQQIKKINHDLGLNPLDHLITLFSTLTVHFLLWQEQLQPKSENSIPSTHRESAIGGTNNGDGNIHFIPSKLKPISKFSLILSDVVCYPLPAFFPHQNSKIFSQVQHGSNPCSFEDIEGNFQRCCSGFTTLTPHQQPLPESSRPTETSLNSGAQTPTEGQELMFTFPEASVWKGWILMVLFTTISVITHKNLSL